MSEIKIVIGPDRHVWVGEMRLDGETVIIEKAQNIRYWPVGGLGALCSGPKKDAKLDPCGTVRIHWLRVFTYDCTQKSWGDFLANK